MRIPHELRDEFPAHVDATWWRVERCTHHHFAHQSQPAVLPRE